MNRPILFILTIFLAYSAWAKEEHADGYSLGVNGAEAKNGTVVEIKIGHVSQKPLGREITQIEAKEGFARYALYPAENAQGKRISECEVSVGYAYVSDRKKDAFEQKYAHPQINTDPNNPFSGKNMIYTKVDGILASGILWKMGNRWVIVIQ